MIGRWLMGCTGGFAPFSLGLRPRSGVAGHRHGAAVASSRAGFRDRVRAAITAPGLRCMPLVFVAGACLGTSASAASLSGEVRLFADDRPLRSEQAREAVIYFQPAGGAVTVQALPEPVVMTTRRKRFEPRTLAIPVGSRVQFPNEDPILHNVFSTARGNAFDVGLLAQGEGSEVRFDHAGYVRVYCNVHHAMVGHILVLDTPHYTRPDADGRFRLDGLPDGEGELVIWHDRSRPWRQRLDPSVTASVASVRIDLSQRRVPPHMNKFGQPYGRDSGRGY